jgi:hypothetical protein
MKLEPDAPAAMTWLPRGETATIEVFGAQPALSADLWTLGDVVKHALEMMRDHDKIPWAMVGKEVLGPSEICQVASALRTMGVLL